MKLLILGPRGQLGHDLCEAVRAVPGGTAVPLDRDGIDLRRTDGIRSRIETLEFDALVNCAAYTKVDQAEIECAEAFALNAYAPEELARACREMGRLFVQVSTDYVFSGKTEFPYAPEDAPGPVNVYGASKLVGEVLGRNAHPAGTLVVRTSSVFGLAGGGLGSAGNFVETMLRLGRERSRLRVVSDTVMTPTHSADLAAGILQLLAADAPPGIYHLTNTGRASWHEFATTIMEEAGLEVSVEPISASDYPTPARRPRFSVLDTTATDALIGPRPHWRDALADYLRSRSTAVPLNR